MAKLESIFTPEVTASLDMDEIIEILRDQQREAGVNKYFNYSDLVKQAKAIKTGAQDKLKERKLEAKKSRLRSADEMTKAKAQYVTTVMGLDVGSAAFDQQMHSLLAPQRPAGQAEPDRGLMTGTAGGVSRGKQLTTPDSQSAIVKTMAAINPDSKLWKILLGGLYS